MRAARLQRPVKAMPGVGVTDLDLQVARLDKIRDDIAEMCDKSTANDGDSELLDQAKLELLITAALSEVVLSLIQVACWRHSTSCKSNTCIFR